MPPPRKIKGPGEPEQVDALVQAVRQHKGFRQMAQYNVMCLLSHISPPAVGWMENVRYAVESGAINAIIDVLKTHPGALDVVRTSIEALRKLATDTRNAELLAKGGAITAALDAMLKSGDDAVGESGGELIATISQHKPDAVVQSQGAIDSLLGALGTAPKVKVMSSILNTLDRVCRVEAGDAEVRKKNGVKILLGTLAKGKETSEATLLPTFRILERFAANDPKVIKEMKDNGGLENIVHQLEIHSTNEPILRAGGRLLGAIALEDLEDTIGKLNNSSLSPETRQFLTALISNLALRPENVDKIVKHGGIKALVTGFSDFAPATKEAAARAFGRIALANEDNVQQLFQNGVPQILTSAINNANESQENVLTAATYALANMATTKENCKKLEDTGAPNAVLKKLKEFPMKEGFVAEALRLWEAMGRNGHDMGSLVKNGVTKAVIDGMRANQLNAEVQTRGFQTWEHLLRDTGGNGKAGAEVFKEIIANDGVKLAGAVLNTHAANPEVAAAGFKALLEFWEKDPKQAAKAFTQAKIIGSIMNCAYMQNVAGNKRMDELIKALVSRVMTPKETEDLVALIKKAAMTLCSTKTDESADRLEEHLRTAAMVCKAKPHADAFAKAGGAAVLLSCWHDVLQVGEDVPRLGDIMETFGTAVISLAKSDRKHLKALVDAGGIKISQEPAKGLNNVKAVASALRALRMFAAAHEYKTRVVEEGGIETCVTAMRVNSDKAPVFEAALEVLLPLSTVDELAAAVCNRGGTRQILKGLTDNVAAPTFEHATELSLFVLEKVANASPQHKTIPALVKQGAIAAVIQSMEAFPRNDTIEATGARVLALLLDKAGVEEAVIKMKDLAAKLASSKDPDAILPELGRAAALVGYLALAPTNAPIMKENAVGAALVGALKTMEGLPDSTNKQQARRAMYRALGQMAATDPSLFPKGTVPNTLKAALNDDKVSPYEKIAVLEAIKNIASNQNDPAAANELIDQGILGDILNLMKKNGHDEALMAAALGAVGALAEKEAGAKAFTDLGGREFLTRWLRDNKETAGPRAVEAAMIALANLALIDANVPKMLADGVVDMLVAAMDALCLDPNNPQPRVLNAAVAVMGRVATNEDAIRELVRKGAVQRAIQIARSNPTYLGDADAMEALIFLLESCALVNDVRPDMVRAGAIELIMDAMNVNHGNDDVVRTGAHALQTILGSSPDTLKEILKDVTDLAAKLKKNPNDRDLQDQLDKALQNLANMMMVEGVVTPGNAAEMAHALADVLNNLNSLPDGPVKSKLVARGAQALARLPLLDGIKFDESEALKRLVEALRANPDDANALENVLTAIGNLMTGPKALRSLIGLNGIDDIARVMAMAADDAKLREAAKRAMERIQQIVEQDPSAVDPALMSAIVNSFGGDSGALRDLLKRMVTNGGTPPLMKLFGMNPEFDLDLLRALREGHAGMGLELNFIDGNALKALVAALKAGGDRAREALKAISMMSPASLLEFAKNGGLDALLKMMMDNMATPEDVLQCLMAMNRMAEFDPNALAKLLASLGGVDKIKQILEKYGDNPDIVREAIKLLDAVNKALGTDKLPGVDNSLLNLVEGLAMKHQLEPAAKNLLDSMRGFLGVGGPEMIGASLDKALQAMAGASDIEERKDDDGKVYYFDKKSGQQTWQKPQAYAAVISAMEGLAKLTEAHKEHITAVNPKALTAAVGQIEMNKNEPAKLTALAKALATLASNNENRNAIAKAGGLQAIIQALNADNLDPEFVEAAINLLNQMSKNDQFRDQIAKLGGIKALIKIMLKFIDHKQVVERCLSALANLGYNSDANVAEIVKEGGIEATVKVMQRWKDETSVLQLALVLINNVMYGNEATKLRIGREAGKQIVAVCERWHKDVKTFNAANRCMGNLSIHDENIRLLVDAHATKQLVAGMEVHPSDVGAQQIAIDVIGNFASLQEDKDQAKIARGELQSVFDIIVLEGGAARILKTVKETSEVNLLMSGMDALANLANDQRATEKMLKLGIVPMVVNAMAAYDWDEELMARTVRLLATLTFNAEGVKEIVAKNGIQVVLSGMESHIEEPDFLISAVVALKNIASQKEFRVEIDKLGGVETVLAAFERHIDHRPLIMEILLLFVRMTMNETSSEAIATKGMHVILKSIHGRANDADFLTRSFVLLGHLAFHNPNLKIIAQYGGVGLIIESICNHPESREMLLKAVQTLDNIAMASAEHAKIVTAEGGAEAVKAVQEAYSDDQEMVQICKSALLTMSALETRQAKPRRDFLNSGGDGMQKGEDPLKEYRNMLKAGTVMTEWSNGGPHSRHILIDQEFANLVWKDPKKGTKGNSMPLRDIRIIRAGAGDGHANLRKKAKPDQAFSIVGRAITLDLETESPELQKAWVAAMGALLHCVRRDPQWLR